MAKILISLCMCGFKHLSVSVSCGWWYWVCMWCGHHTRVYTLMSEPNVNFTDDWLGDFFLGSGWTLNVFIIFIFIWYSILENFVFPTLTYTCVYVCVCVLCFSLHFHVASFEKCDCYVHNSNIFPWNVSFFFKLKKHYKTRVCSRIK